MSRLIRISFIMECTKGTDIPEDSNVVVQSTSTAKTGKKEKTKTKTKKPGRNELSGLGIRREEGKFIISFM
jgi:hypothetical protein